MRPYVYFIIFLFCYTIFPGSVIAAETSSLINHGDWVSYILNGNDHLEFAAMTFQVDTTSGLRLYKSSQDCRLIATVIRVDVGDNVKKIPSRNNLVGEVRIDTGSIYQINFNAVPDNDRYLNLFIYILGDFKRFIKEMSEGSIIRFKMGENIYHRFSLNGFGSALSRVTDMCFSYKGQQLKDDSKYFNNKPVQPKKNKNKTNDADFF